jgi:hypothetical protein
MDRLLFLNVGWMSKYQGLKRDTITGGGTYVSRHGYGHELLNFQPYRGRMYGFGQVPHSSIRIENLDAPPGAASVDGALVIWVASSRIVGWYKNATVFRRIQPPPKSSARFYQGDPIGYNVTADVRDCKLLIPDARLFPVPRSQERADAMGRYLWYAKGPKNESFRKEVLAYILAGGTLTGKANGTPATWAGSRQPDVHKRQKVDHAAIDLAAAHFEDLGYVVDSVEGDNVGWDLEAIHEASGDSLRIEVKGLSGSAICVEMTRQEYEMMRRHKKNYRVCVVTRALIKGARALHIFSYVETTRTWIDDADQPLHIQEVLSARLRAG